MPRSHFIERVLCRQKSHYQCSLVTVLAGTVYRHPFHAAGKFCENQLKASVLVTLHNAHYYVHEQRTFDATSNTSSVSSLEVVVSKDRRYLAGTVQRIFPCFLDK